MGAEEKEQDGVQGLAGVSMWSYDDHVSFLKHANKETNK
jgi:hypothetical protein